MNPPFRLEPLAAEHDRNSFSCGSGPLDRYLKTQVSQDVRRRLAACFVAVENASGRLAAYHTIASASIPITDLPDDVTKRLPRHPSIPAVRISRLAVDLTFRGRGLGSALVADALRRVVVAPPAAFALLVDVKDEQAAAFYRHLGFQALTGTARTLFLPIAVAEKALLF